MIEQRVQSTHLKITTKFVGVLFFVAFLLILRQVHLFGVPSQLGSVVQSWKWLEVKDVVVSVEWPLTETLVLQGLPQYAGRNMLTIDPRSIYEALSSKPWVDKVSVKKEYPNRLQIFVSTKKARAITLIGGQPFFMSVDGEKIDRVTSEMLKVLDLPFVSNDFEDKKWNIPSVIESYELLRSKLGEKHPISQVVLGVFPYLKFFLANPKIEVVLNIENYVSQIPSLITLLDSPPSQVGQIQKINLVFPKKAIVTRSLSQ